jgi:hypothetical protein
MRVLSALDTAGREGLRWSQAVMLRERASGKLTSAMIKSGRSLRDHA